MAHTIRKHPAHDCVDVDTAELLDNPPAEMVLGSTVHRISHQRSWFLHGSDGRSYHFDEPTCYDTGAIEGWLRDNRYERCAGYMQGDLRYVRN